MHIKQHLTSLVTRWWELYLKQHGSHNLEINYEERSKLLYYWPLAVLIIKKHCSYNGSPPFLCIKWNFSWEWTLEILTSKTHILKSENMLKCSLKLNTPKPSQRMQELLKCYKKCLLLVIRFCYICLYILFPNDFF